MTNDTYDPHRSTTEVRQGDRRQMNLRVLVISTVAVVALLALAYLLGYAFVAPRI